MPCARSRALALRGAEILFMPAGVEKGRLWATWRALLWARAIENLAVVVSTQNLFSAADRDLALVALPEEIVYENASTGVGLIEVSLGRVRELRGGRDAVDSSRRCGAKEGLLSPQ